MNSVLNASPTNQLKMESQIHPLNHAVAQPIIQRNIDHGIGGRCTGLLRFATAGSVDDGKSTLIGRLLYDSKSLLSDHVTAIEAASRRRGLSEVDLSLLTDGLIAEREQGITIDVAYRYFATPARKFIIADSPGHAQYTRNMVTAASTADVAVLLVDASKGLQTQTRRHAYLSRWVGIRRVVLAVNKMDLVDYSQPVFDAIVSEFRAFASELTFDHICTIPLSALRGDMVVDRGDSLDWYHGPTLLQHLETVPAANDEHETQFRFAVQRVVRVPRGQGQPGSPFNSEDFRGWQGTVASGSVRVGDEVVAWSSGLRARIKQIYRLDHEVSSASADHAVTITLDRELDISRGDLLCHPDSAPSPQRETRAQVCWFDREPLAPDHAYLIKLGTQTAKARLSSAHSRIDVDALGVQQPGGNLAMNDIGTLRISTQVPLPFEAYAHNRINGSFIVIDATSKRTVGAGIVV